MATTTTDFLKDVRQRGQIPSLTTDGISAPELEVTTDEGLLRLASGELRTWMVPRLLESRGEWLVATQDFTLSAERRYRIPSRAAGGSLRTLFWLPSGTVETVELSQVDASEEPRRQGDFRVEGGKVVLLNPNIASGTLRMAYHIRPGTLVLPTSCARENESSSGATYDSATQRTTLLLQTEPPAGWALGMRLDVVLGNSLYEVVYADVQVQSVSRLSTGGGTNSVTLLGDRRMTPEQVAGGTGFIAGDGPWVCPAGQTCVLPLPEDWWELFAQRVAARALETAGLGKEAQAAYDTLEGLLEGLAVVTARERVQGSRRKVRNTRMWGG